MKKREKTTVTLILSADEFKALQELADESGISKSEFLRLIIQGIWLGKTVTDGKKGKITIGGYGYTFDPKEMESLFQDMGEKLCKAVDVKPVIGNEQIRYKRIKTPKKVA
jgi:predicted transcriptional regulator